MLMTRFDPLREIANMQRAFNHISKEQESTISSYSPLVNTREGETSYMIDVDLPGIKKEDISIDVHEGTLTISGERNFKQEVKEEDYYKVESAFGKFQRAFSLPKNIDIENISASSNEGVLEIVIPKLDKDANTKKIEIK